MDEYEVADSDGMFYEVMLYSWKAGITVANVKKKNAKDGSKKFFSVFQDQSSLRLTTNVEGSSSFKEIEAKQNGIGLLGLIQEVMCGVEQHLQMTWVTVKVNRSLFTLWQRNSLTNDNYLKLFGSQVTVLTTCRGKLLLHLVLVMVKLLANRCTDTNNLNAGQLIKDEAMAHEEYITYLALSGTDGTQF